MHSKLYITVMLFRVTYFYVHIFECPVDYLFMNSNSDGWFRLLLCNWCQLIFWRRLVAILYFFGDFPYLLVNCADTCLVFPGVSAFWIIMRLLLVLFIYLSTLNGCQRALRESLTDEAFTKFTVFEFFVRTFYLSGPTLINSLLYICAF